MFRVVVTTKYPQTGSLSEDFEYIERPDEETLRDLKRDAKERYYKVYRRSNPQIDITIRTIK